MIESASEQPARWSGISTVFSGLQDLGGLGHEVHAAEHDGVLGRLGGDPRQRQRVADVVGDVLDGGQLVVVRQQRRAAQLGQPAHLGGPFLVAVDTGIAGRTSS